MRRKIKFPHREKLIEREVRHERDGYYIVSVKQRVRVTLVDGVWMIDPAWNNLYKIRKENEL